jgi:predicted PurR-regulated permease PerM
MLEQVKNQPTPLKILVLLLIAAVSIYLLQIAIGFLTGFSDIIIIVLVSWLLSFILEPVVHFISRITKLPKALSALFIYVFFGILFTAGILLLIPTFVTEFESFSKMIPKFLSQYPQAIQTWNKAITNSLGTLISILPSLANILVDIFLILILSFYFIVDKEKINEEILKIAPKNWHIHIRFFQSVIDSSFSSFFRVQVIFAVIGGFSAWIILTIFGIEFGAFAAVLAGLLTLIPVLGQFLGIIPPVFVALVTHPESPFEALITGAIMLAVQQIVFNVFGPKLLGKAFNLHPIVIFLSIIIGFKVAGPMGAVFVVPVLAIAVIVIKKLGIHFINPESE